jgi:DNA polymerase III subunit gamma/tau
MDTPTSHYTVLARRFRPQTFDEVIGQQHVAQALKNAIAGGRVAHAYLFTGARGVGKTSMARIFAKALNCPNVVDGVPCNACEICNGVSAGNDVDVLEIDGASNTGVDNIRDLRANVGVKSMRCRYKVYIIDEVHMLSRSAFNALLKTLEEPPPSVKFVFCTTEPTKIPDTILSRCQRFDFASIETQNIVQRLKEIADSEGYQVEADALELVARRAGGSMRDSQSLFDQLLAFGSETITAQDVHRLLGTADDERLTTIVHALARRDRDAALGELDAALSDGVQLSELTDQLIHYFRDLMIIASHAEKVALQSVAEILRPELSPQAESWGLATIVAALQILVEAKGRMFRAPYARAMAELALVRITLLDNLEDLAALIRDLSSGDGAQTRTGGPPPARGPAASPQSRPQSDERLEPGGHRPSASDAPPAVSTPRAQEFTKKSPDTPDIWDKTAQSSTKSPAAVLIQPGAEGGIMSQLIENTDDTSRTNLKYVSIAIPGPNQVDLLFPPSYHFPKQYCDRPEIRGRFESILTKAAGKPVKVNIRIDTQATPVAPPTERNAEEAIRSSRVDLSQADNDPFVQQAMSVFGGTIKQIDRIGDTA